MHCFSDSQLHFEAFLEDWEPTKDSILVVRALGMSLLKIPLAETEFHGIRCVDVGNWEWSGSVFDEGEEKRFSDYLGKQIPLVQFNKSFALFFSFATDECTQLIKYFFLRKL